MNDEILVHISAPATRQNDELFRSLAEAYVDFVPHIRYGHELHHQLQEQIGSVASEESASPRPAETSILSTSKDSYGSFPSLVSSGSRNDNLSRPGRELGLENIGVDSVPTSSRLAHLDHIQTRWKEQQPSRSNFANEQRESNWDSRKFKNGDAVFVEDTQLGAQALQSQLIDSYPVTSEDILDDEPSQESVRNIHIRTEQVHENTIVECLEAPALTATTTSLKSGRSLVARSDTRLTPSASKRRLPNPAHKFAMVNGRSQEDFSKLPINVFAPAPKVSIERPSKLPSQVTEHLAAIKAHNTKRFQPTKKREAPKSDDRGYWSIDCSQWPIAIQYDFWTTACGHVLSGRLGWGITLHREALFSQNLGLIRVYCWAEVVEHIWLVLWLCSKGLVAQSGSKWIDAGGEVVYEVLL